MFNSNVSVQIDNLPQSFKNKFIRDFRATKDKSFTDFTQLD